MLELKFMFMCVREERKRNFYGKKERKRNKGKMSGCVVKGSYG
jgi:hypothetical protein